MGLFWDLLQQGQIMNAQSRTYTLEERVANLENELRRTQELLQKTLQALEQYTGRDIDQDGRIG